MTKEEVLELSYAATDLHAFANMIEERVRRQEREACAKIADEHINGTPEWNSAANNIAEAIRARGQA
jgi:hypothetical protein